MAGFERPCGRRTVAAVYDIDHVLNTTVLYMTSPEQNHRSARMSRRLSAEHTVVGHASEAPRILRGLARLIEGNFQDTDVNVTHRQMAVAHLRVVADAVEHALGTADAEYTGSLAREWMVELRRQLGIKGWSIEREKAAITGEGSSELDE